MPRPSKYVSRSDLGWGTSPASRANPRSGLVIHYDSVNQGLSGKEHSACLTYWRNTRAFHTGPSRGWADIGYCVDEETEVLTENGWRSFRRVRAGDTALTLDHTTGTSQWQPIQAVNVFPATERTLIRLEGRSHSSLTTPHHRWPVERAPHPGHDTEHPPGEHWATTETLTARDLIRTAAPCDHLTDEPKWPHTLVEEVARAWAGRTRPSPRPREHLTEGVPHHAFLRALTREQLDLLLRIAAPEGSVPDRASAEALQFAAVLAGRAAHLHHDEHGWAVAPDHRALLPINRDQDGPTLREEPYGGHIWCPTTPNGTWLARRRGTVYFTGNSFMACPHGYVIEGRGLYRTQAAQPGGNSSHYSCTLATGPTDAITPEQINAVRMLRQWLMEPDTSIAGAVLGHRDFISTSCPGDRAYQLVQDGTFTQPPGAVTEGLDLLGLKEGDGIPTPSEGVKAVQRLIVAAGFGEHLEPYGVDGQWGKGTSAGLLAARHYVGSGVTSIKSMTGESYAQLIRACARREAERAVKGLDSPDSGGDGSLPGTETVDVSGRLTIER
ncbi:hypothetical protein ACWFMI_08020 [Nocardiopsis terrae]